MKKTLLAIAISILSVSGFSFEYNRVPAGLIKGCRQQYVSGTTIKVGVGYGEIMGSYWEIGPDSPYLTSGFILQGLSVTTNGEMHYIYIDRNNSSLPNVSLRNSTVAPAWSDDFMGWYQGRDRCIGVIRVLPSGQIGNFYCPDDITYLNENVVFTQIGGVPQGFYTNWAQIDISAYTPVNLSRVRFGVEAWGTSGMWTYCTVGFKTDELPFGNVQNSGATNAMASAWVPLSRGAGRVLRWMAYASSSYGQVNRYVMGYEIER